MFVLNKIVWFLVNPAMVSVAGLVVAAVLLFRKSARARIFGRIFLFASLAVLYFTSIPLTAYLLGTPLESPYLPFERVENLPEAEAIVALGGGMTKAETRAYPDMQPAADRVWHAARLYHAGKAPRVVLSGSSERESSLPLLLALGVPDEAIVIDNESRNTYENSRFTEKLLGSGRKVLLVTSAWHMTRALGNFSKTSLETIPAPADFTVTTLFADGFDLRWLAPSPGNAELVSYLMKEWIGRLARR